MLLSTGSRMSYTDQKWDPTRTRTTAQGHSPTLIEPVSGSVTLRNIDAAKTVSAVALDGSGKPIGDPLQAKKTAAGWELPIGTPVTPWYVIAVSRK